MSGKSVSDLNYNSFFAGTFDATLITILPILKNDTLKCQMLVYERWCWSMARQIVVVMGATELLQLSTDSRPFHFPLSTRIYCNMPPPRMILLSFLVISHFSSSRTNFTVLCLLRPPEKSSSRLLYRYILLFRKG